MSYIYAVNSATKQFVYGGRPSPYDVIDAKGEGLSPGQVRRVMNVPVDLVLDRDTGDPDHPRKATPQELADALTASQSEKADAAIGPLLEALCAVIAGKKASDTAADLRAALKQQLTGKV